MELNLAQQVFANLRKVLPSAEIALRGTDDDAYEVEIRVDALPLSLLREALEAATYMRPDHHLEGRMEVRRSPLDEAPTGWLIVSAEVPPETSVSE